MNTEEGNKLIAAPNVQVLLLCGTGSTSPEYRIMVAVMYVSRLYDVQPHSNNTLLDACGG